MTRRNKRTTKNNKNKSRSKKNSRGKKNGMLINRTSQRDASSGRAQNLGPISNRFYERVCGQINPFCHEALGAKIPDLSSAKTLTLCVRQFIPVTTDADGNAMHFYQGAFSSMGAIATLASGVVTVWNEMGSSSQYTNVSDAVIAYRTVSFGVRFFQTLSLMDCKGTMTASEVDYKPPVGANVTNPSLSTVSTSRSILGDQLLWVSKPTDIEYTDFKLIADPAAGAQRTALVLQFFGAVPSATIGVAEIVLNLEMTPRSGTVASYYTTTASPSIPVVMDTASNVMRDMPSFFSGETEAFTKLVVDEVKTVGSTALRVGGSAVRAAVTAALMH